MLRWVVSVFIFIFMFLFSLLLFAAFSCSTLSNCTRNSCILLIYLPTLYDLNLPQILGLP